jgi:hypothetical protein
MVVALAIPGQASGGDLKGCPDAAFSVSAPSTELAQEVCQILTETAEMMSTCGLRQTHPICVEVVDGISHPIGECLAYWDCESDTITVADPSAFPKILTPENPYSRLPPSVLLRTLLTHELAHALVYQSAGPHRIDIVDQEYVAAALELEYLADVWREVLLQASPMSLPPKVGLIDIWIYGLAPRKFATNAWQHFRQDGNGCDLVMRIVEGQFSFK